MGKQTLFNKICNLANQKIGITAEQAAAFLLLGKDAFKVIGKSDLSGLERIEFNNCFNEAKKKVKQFIIDNIIGNNTPQQFDLGGGRIISVIDALPFNCEIFIELLGENAFKNYYSANIDKFFDITLYFKELNINPNDFLFSNPASVRWAIIPALFCGKDYALALKNNEELFSLSTQLKADAFQLVESFSNSQQLTDIQKKALENLLAFLFNLFSNSDISAIFSVGELSILNVAAKNAKIEPPLKFLNEFFNVDYYNAFKAEIKAAREEAEAVEGAAAKTTEKAVL